MEFFVVARSKAAPFVSDTDTYFVEAEDADDAVSKAVADYSHPFGLYALGVWTSADAYHKGEKTVGDWRSKEALEAMVVMRRP